MSRHKKANISITKREALLQFEHYTPVPKTTKMPLKAVKHNDKSRKYHCQSCFKSFTRSATLRDHPRTHNNERQFQCLHCGKWLTRAKDRNHHQALHEGEKNFVCKGIALLSMHAGTEWECGRKFAREDAPLIYLRAESSWECMTPLLKDVSFHEQKSASGLIATARRHLVSNGGAIQTIGCQQHFATQSHLLSHLCSESGRDCIRRRLIVMAIENGRKVREKHRENHSLKSRV